MSRSSVARLDSDRCTACGSKSIGESTDTATISRRIHLHSFFNAQQANCDVSKWIVSNEWRVGIFAARDIKAGTELTIDYQYDKVGSIDRQPCYCGEPNCAQFIGGKKKTRVADDSRPAAQKKGPSQTTLARQARQDAYLAADEDCAMCGDGGDLVMCDVCLPDGRFCPRVYHVSCLGDQVNVPKGSSSFTCPYHYCSQCWKKNPKIFCVGCSDSFCETCFVSVASDFKACKVREDTDTMKYVMCEVCAEEPLRLDAEERIKWDELQKQKQKSPQLDDLICASSSNDSASSSSRDNTLVASSTSCSASTSSACSPGARCESSTSASNSAEKEKENCSMVNQSLLMTDELKSRLAQSQSPSSGAQSTQIDHKHKANAASSLAQNGRRETRNRRSSNLHQMSSDAHASMLQMFDSMSGGCVQASKDVSLFLRNTAKMCNMPVDKVRSFWNAHSTNQQAKSGSNAS